MKFSIERDRFLKPLQLLNGVVGRKQGMPILSNILISIEKNKLCYTGTDLDVELSGNLKIDEVEDEGTITLPAKKLLDICRALPPGDLINFSTQDSKVRVTSGKSRFLLATLPANEYPTLEESEYMYQCTLPQDELRYLVEQTQFSMAQQDVRYYLNGLYLNLAQNQILAVATDGHRLALSQVDTTESIDQPLEMIVPRKGVNEILRLLDEPEQQVQLKFGRHHLKIELEDLQFTTKLIDGKFPDYRSVIPQPGGHLMVAPREALKQSLTRTAILASDKYRGIRLVFEENKLFCQTHNPEQEEAEEDLEVSYSGEPIEIGFNVNYLIDVLNALPDTEVQFELRDSNSSILIKGLESKECQYVVMPMRL